MASKGLVVPFKFTPAFAVTKPAALDFTFEVSTQFVPFHRKVLSVAVPAGKRLTVFQTGVFPAPALINTCPDVPAEPLASNGLFAPLRFTPAFAVTKPAALDFTFEVSTQFVPFHRKVLSVAVPLESKFPVVQVGVLPAPALVRNCPAVPAAPLSCNGLVAPLRFVPALTVKYPVALEVTFEVSTQFVPFHRNVLSVAVPFATPPDEAIVKVPAPAVNVILAPAVSVDQDGVDPAPPLVRN